MLSQKGKDQIPKVMNKRQLRVLIFTFPSFMISSIVKALSPFAIVKEVTWQYKPLPLDTRYICLKLFYRMIEGLYWSLRVFKESRRFHADVILVQWAYYNGLIGTLAATLSRKKLVIRSVGSDLKIWTQTRLGMSTITIVLKRACGVICVSRDLERIARRLGAINTIVIPSPLDLSGFSVKNFRKEGAEIISVASLEPIKGISFLIKALTYIKDGKLVVMGDGSEREKLEFLSSALGLDDRVLFLGWIKHDSEFWDYLQKATVFVLPSLSEGLPRALIEAMACGLPIVATAVGGIPEVVTDGINGFLVPSEDEKALAKAIEKVLNNINFQKSASKENKKVARKYTPEAIGQRVHEYLNGIAKD